MKTTLPARRNRSAGFLLQREELMKLGFCARLVKAGLAAALATAGLSTMAEAAEIRFVHAYPVASQHHRNVQWYTEQVTERTNGEVTFRIFPSAQLMPINQELPAILAGEVGMTYTVAPVAASVEPLWGIFDIPFLFDVRLDDTSHGERFFASEKGGGLLASAMEKRGFKLISIAPTDYPSSVYLTAPKAISKLEDLKGLKLRSPGGKMGQLAGEAFGYSPVAIAGVELIPALSQGVVDGGILPPIYAHDNKLPVKGLTIAPYTWPAVTPIIMSLELFQGLTEQQQTVMMEVGEELRSRSLEIVEKSTGESIEALKAGGADVVFLSDEESERWRTVARPLWETFAADNGENARTMLDDAVALRSAD